MHPARARLLGPWSFYRSALGVAVPVMLQQAVMSLVSLVDNFMVAGLGDARMAAVNVANQINFVYFVVLFTLCGAGGIYLSQFKGAGDEEGMRQAYRFKLAASLLVSGIWLSLTLAIPERMVALMLGGNPQGPEIIREAAGYLRIVSIAWIPMAVSTSLATGLREIGRARPPLYISVVATLVNTFFNWLLIYGSLGAPRLGVNGAAIATVIARLVELAAFLAFVRFDRTSFVPRLRELAAVKLKLFREVVRKSGPMLLSETTWVVSETVITALYNGRGGAEVVAGMAAGWTIANVFFLVFTGIHTATGVTVGGSLGADRLDEARDRARWIQSGAVLAGAALGALEALSTLGIPVVFGNLSHEAREVSRGLLFVISAYLPLWALLNAQFAVSRAGGDTMMGMVVDVGVNLLLFLPGAFALALLTPIGPVPMFALLKSTDFVKWLAAWLWLRGERWVRNLTREHEVEAGPGIEAEAIAVAGAGTAAGAVTLAD